MAFSARRASSSSSLSSSASASASQFVLLLLSITIYLVTPPPFFLPQSLATAVPAAAAITANPLHLAKSSISLSPAYSAAPSDYPVCLKGSNVVESKIDKAREEGKHRAVAGAVEGGKEDVMIKKAEVEQDEKRREVGERHQASLERELELEYKKGDASANNNNNDSNDNNDGGARKTEKSEGEGEDTESPLDHSNFLSFEEWRSQNSAKVGQSSMEQKHNRRQQQQYRKQLQQQHQQRQKQQQQQQQKRRQPNNPYDEAFGGEGEIDFGFAGFASDADAPPVELTIEKIRGGNVGRAQVSNGPSGSVKDGTTATDTATAKPTTAVGGEGASPDESLWVPPRQNAGITRKERFNYASFDCAATVLKTNPQCAGASAILAENKEMYMLNECRAQNKFIILELCDDILVDTIALANYEFFSSIFRTFRVSVADRYPPKSVQWKELGTYEALNTRDIQAFPVENPLIWARYLKLEFLTHYGNEFYCPLSLVRVHGTTMMEEYKAEGEAERVEKEAEAAAEIAEQEAESKPNADPAVPYEKEESQSQPPDVMEQEEQQQGDHVVEDVNAAVSSAKDKCQVIVSEVERRLRSLSLLSEDGLCGIDDDHDADSAEKSPSTNEGEKGPKLEDRMEAGSSISISVTQQPEVTITQPTAPAADHQEKVAGQSVSPQSIPVDNQAISAQTNSNEIDASKTTSAVSRSSSTAQTEIRVSTAQESTSISSTTPPTESRKQQQPPPSSSSLLSQSPPSMPPPPPNPTTQESFFKSVNKRLQMLETNSTLSLLYIEEQSRLLRDAFLKTEKRQLTKTSSFLSNLNRTVLAELHEFRQQYDQVWQSVITEFEQQHTKYHQEVYTVSRQLGLLADELMFQKRLFLVQSIFVLILFGVVLFSRNNSSTRGYFDPPRTIFRSIADGRSSGSERNEQPQFGHGHSHHRRDNSSIGSGFATGANTPSYVSPLVSPDTSPVTTTFPTPRSPPPPQQQQQQQQQQQPRSPLSTTVTSAANTFRLKSLLTLASPRSEDSPTPTSEEGSRHSRQASAEAISPS